MAQYTENYNLYLEDSGETTFNQWRDKMNGPTDSNMKKIDDALAGKQDTIIGTEGQVVGFNAQGKPVAQAAPDTGVTTFNGRTGAVTPKTGDYTAEQVGARPSTWTPTAADVGARPSTWTPTAADVGARPSTWTPTAADVGAKASGWKPFYAGTSAPSDTTQLWIDTTANTGGLKYYNGSNWVHVPMSTV